VWDIVFTIFVNQNFYRYIMKNKVLVTTTLGLLLTISAIATVYTQQAQGQSLICFSNPSACTSSGTSSNGGNGGAGINGGTGGNGGCGGVTTPGSGTNGQAGNGHGNTGANGMNGGTGGCLQSSGGSVSGGGRGR
jgi:hypothetical protein